MNALMRTTLLILLLCLSPSSWTATVCVDSAVNLVQAIDAIEDQPEGSIYTIKIVQGTYNVDGAIQMQEAYGHGVRVLGGYTAGCVSRVVNPSNTVLDGRGASSVLGVWNRDADSEVLVEGLTVTRFHNFSAINLQDSDQSRLEVRHCRVINNQVDEAISLWGSRMVVSNNLVAGNSVAAADGAVLLEYRSGSDSAAVVNNNTIANNTGGPGLKIISADGSYRLGEVANNIIYGNTVDLNLLVFFYSGHSLSVRGNLYGTMLGTPLTSDNIVANPLFANAAGGDYSLALISPAVNSGAASQHYSFPSRDIVNRTRIIGSRIDRGAFESPQDDLNGFIVSTTADNGNNSSPTPGSLRAAIKAGNAAGTPYKVSFALSGCPLVININTALPDISGDVTIDGRTQNGWSPNSSYGAFDANLCLVLNGSGANVPWAFHVPGSASNAHLTVRGLVLTGFSDAAIKLEGGHDHHVLGNQIGAIAFTTASDKGVYVGGNASGSYIGGFDDPSAVNLIAGTNTAGIYLENAAGGSVVANNVIGFQPDGVSAAGNGIGVYVFNSPGNHISYNYIGNSDNAGVQLSGSSSQLNTLQYNVIGVTALGAPAGNATAGVALSFGARQNTIGAPLTGGYGTNIISSNGGPGVWVTPSGGAGNRVLSGYFDRNTGLSIDLDAGGPTPNPSSPSSSGPNLRQAYPVLTHAIRNTNPTTVSLFGTLSASLANSLYRIDFYRDNDCGRNDRGIGGNAIGRINVSTNGNGVAAIDVTLGLPSDSPLNGGISATATDSNGNTSELGNCARESDGNTAALFADGFE